MKTDDWELRADCDSDGILLDTLAVSFSHVECCATKQRFSLWNPMKTHYSEENAQATRIHNELREPRVSPR